MRFAFATRQREVARVARVWVLHAACVSASQRETQMMGLGVGHRTIKEGPMGMKASEVGAWLRKNTGKRDHHELMPQDYVVLRPGPNFHWLMGMLNDTPAP